MISHDGSDGVCGRFSNIFSQFVTGFKCSLILQGLKHKKCIFSVRYLCVYFSPICVITYCLFCIVFFCKNAEMSFFVCICRWVGAGFDLPG